MNMFSGVSRSTVARRFLPATALAATLLGVTSAYAWHGSLSTVSNVCDRTGGAVTFSGTVSDPQSSSWKIQVTGPTTAAQPLGQNQQSGVYQVTVDHLLDGSYSATLVTSKDKNAKITPKTVTFHVSCHSSSHDPAPAATPELGSGELLATGILPLGGVLLYRRRRARRATQQQ